MIIYNIGEIPCKIDFNDFLSLTTDVKKYKSEFYSFADLYEFIDKNITKITNILFDNYEYTLENGKLHNLYGPAITKFTSSDSDYVPKGTKSYWFYIDGKLVCDQLNDRGCKKIENFKNNEIFHYEEITNKKSEVDQITGIFYRRKEGIDYIKHYINLEYRIKKDQRKKKLNQISNLS